jgi:hypothetical protein
MHICGNNKIIIKNKGVYKMINQTEVIKFIKKSEKSYILKNGDFYIIIVDGNVMIKKLKEFKIEKGLNKISGGLEEFKTINKKIFELTEEDKKLVNDVSNMFEDDIREVIDTQLIYDEFKFGYRNKYHIYKDKNKNIFIDDNFLSLLEDYYFKKRIVYTTNIKKSQVSAIYFTDEIEELIIMPCRIIDDIKFLKE